MHAKTHHIWPANKTTVFLSLGNKPIGRLPTSYNANTVDTAPRVLYPCLNEPNLIRGWCSKDFGAVVTLNLLGGCSNDRLCTGLQGCLGTDGFCQVHQGFVCSMSTGCTGASRQSFCEASLNQPLNSSTRTSWHPGFDVYWSLLFPRPVTFLCMIWLLNGGIVITWQVYEGAPGRRAAVRDGEGHGVDLRGQIGDV